MTKNPVELLRRIVCVLHGIDRNLASIDLVPEGGSIVTQDLSNLLEKLGFDGVDDGGKRDESRDNSGGHVDVTSQYKVIPVVSSDPELALDEQFRRVKRRVEVFEENLKAADEILALIDSVSSCLHNFPRESDPSLFTKLNEYVEVYSSWKRTLEETAICKHTSQQKYHTAEVKFASGDAEKLLME